MDWDKLRVFHAVALAGSFSKARKPLNLSQSAISRQVNILEKELGAPLFKRMARGLELTDAGNALNEAVLNVFAKLATAEGAIEELKNHPCGHIQVATSLAFGASWLAPRLQEFLDQFPDVSVTLLLKDEDIDFIMREADIGITALPVEGQDIIHSAPIPYRPRIYASRSYLKAHGTPETPEDLSHHRLIVFGKDMPHLYSDRDWILTVGAQKPRTPYFVANNGEAIYEGTRSGIGLSVLPKYMVGEDPEMVEVLATLPRKMAYRYVVYPKQLASLKRVQVFEEFLVKKMTEEEF